MAQGYWKAIAAIKKLSVAAKVLEDAAKKWLIKQVLWQILGQNSVPTPNLMQQADLLFLLHDKLPHRCSFQIPLLTRLVATKSPKL